MAVATTFSLFPVVSTSASAEDTSTAIPTTQTVQVQVDGKTSETAAASCWEIKQNDPSSTSGTYWLYTPQMSAPQQFYCDQDTDGGGWVLVGRGREGWTEKSTGQGNADDIAPNPDGTDAFTPAQLSANTVTALLNDKPLSEALPQGIRFHRALTTSGSEWQDLYATRENNEKWSWTFSAKAIWRNLTVTDHRWYGDTVQNLGMSLGAISAANTTFYTANFEGMAAQGWKQGFAYGSGVYGKNDASSYIWSQNNGGSGIPASNRRALPNSYTEKVKWRTSEQTGTGSNSELNAYVQAITQIGNTVFIGGDYAYVQNAQTGEKVNQKFLTGYDVNTGELVRAFMPTFNGQVKALEALPQRTVGGWRRIYPS